MILYLYLYFYLYFAFQFPPITLPLFPLGETRTRWFWSCVVVMTQQLGFLFATKILIDESVCLLFTQPPTRQRGLALARKMSPDLGNDIETFDEKLSRIFHCVINWAYQLIVYTWLQLCKYLYCCLLCEKWPKSISLFPCMTMKAFYMISSQHTTAALSLFLIATKNTQVSLISFVGICFCLYFGFAFTKF